MKYVLPLRRVLALAAMAAVTVASQFAGAQVIGGIRPVPPTAPGYPDGAPIYPGDSGYAGYNNDVVTVSVNQQFGGFSSIDVEPYFRYATQGRAIVGLSVRMAAQGRAEAVLLANGAQIGRPFLLSPYLQDYSFDLSRVYPGARIEIRLTGGQTYVQSMTAQLAYDNPYPPPYPPQPPQPPYPPGPRPPYPPPPGPGQDVLTQYVNQLYNGRGVLSIDSLVGLDRYQGRRVNRVIVRMRAERGQASAVLINTGRRGRDSIPVSQYMADHSFFPEGNGRIGYEIRDLSVELRGRIAVESVTVELSRY